MTEITSGPKPEGLRTGAMCYSPGPPPSHWVYVCPACGMRTAYVGAAEGASTYGDEGPIGPFDVERRVPREAIWEMATEVEQSVAAARRLPKLRGLHLDESPLCASCRPDGPDPRPILEVQLQGEAVPRREPFSEEDVRILTAFLRSADRYMGEAGWEHSLQQATGPIRRILLGEREAPPPTEDE